MSAEKDIRAVAFPKKIKMERIQGWRGLLSRSVWFLSALIIMLLIFSLGLLLYSSIRSNEQIRPIQEHMLFITAIEATDYSLRAALLDFLEKDKEYLHPDRLKTIKRDLNSLIQDPLKLSPETQNLLELSRNHLQRFQGVDRQSLDTALYYLRTAMTSEIQAYSSLVEATHDDIRRSGRIVMGLTIALILILIPLWFTTRQRILIPLGNLGYLMNMLSRHDYTSAPVHEIDPLIKPLFENYNRMVTRLAALEAEHQQREASLNDSVRQVSRILLQQQRRLARAERLGAVGEIAASVAHELRNPIASVNMALQNLRADLEDEDHVERVNLTISELKRINEQLNSLLNSAREAPESLIQLDLRSQLNDIARLTSYQLSEKVQIHIDVSESVYCRLPESKFRQSMMNLLLNSGQLIGDNEGTIKVRISRHDDGIIITITDTGPGFPDELLQSGIRAFGSWRRDGTGLGLIMVQRFIKDVGGHLDLSNLQPHGAKVEMQIPCGEEDG